MTWYRVYCGTWHDADGVKLVKETSSRKEAFEKAHSVANAINSIVTIISERKTHLKFDLIKPERVKEAIR